MAWNKVGENLRKKSGKENMILGKSKALGGQWCLRKNEDIKGS